MEPNKTASRYKTLYLKVLSKAKEFVFLSRKGENIEVRNGIVYNYNGKTPIKKLSFLELQELFNIWSANIFPELLMKRYGLRIKRKIIEGDVKVFVYSKKIDYVKYISKNDRYEFYDYKYLKRLAKKIHDYCLRHGVDVDIEISINSGFVIDVLLIHEEVLPDGGVREFYEYYRDSFKIF